jgi:hypothetical protein
VKYFVLCSHEVLGARVLVTFFARVISLNTLCECSGGVLATSVLV